MNLVNDFIISDTNSRHRKTGTVLCWRRIYDI